MNTITTPGISSSKLELRPGQVTLAHLRAIQSGGVLSMAASAYEAMRAAQAHVQHIVDEDQVVYGINTGFGKLASTKIAHDRLAELQRNLVLAQRGHGRAAARPCGAPDPGHQGREPGARPLGRPPGAGRRAAGHGQCRRAARDPGQGLGGCLATWRRCRIWPAC